jgi:uncharacterized protein YdeI (YjbR/CyaY-like superfamily)
MPPVHVDPKKVREFPDADSFYQWLAKHHDVEDEVWIKIHKVGSGRRSISPTQAIDVVLCWGWIDAIRKGFDDKSFLQRYTRRGAKSTWSQINVDNVARLIAEKRMTEHGLRHVEAAKADGRWARAYASGKNLKLPDALLAAVEAEPRAKKMLATLSEQNRFALAFRLHQLKTDAGRQKRIASFVEMLARGETIYPQPVARRARVPVVKLTQTLKPQGPATAIVLTDAQVAELGGGKRAAVTVTIGSKTVRLRLAAMGGQNMIGISKANREALGVDIGDRVDATIAIDAAARTVEVPADAAKALERAKLRKKFDALSYTHQKEQVRAITEAKKPETRSKRIAAMLEKLRG